MKSFKAGMKELIAAYTKVKGPYTFKLDSGEEIWLTDLSIYQGFPGSYMEPSEPAQIEGFKAYHDKELTKELSQDEYDAISDKEAIRMDDEILSKINQETNYGEPQDLVKIAEEQGEYYVDYDDDTGTWCIFHTDKKPGHAYKSFMDKGEAERRCKEMNNKTKTASDRCKCPNCGKDVQGFSAAPCKDLFCPSCGKKMDKCHNPPCMISKIAKDKPWWTKSYPLWDEVRTALEGTDEWEEAISSQQGSWISPTEFAINNKDLAERMIKKLNRGVYREDKRVIDFSESEAKTATFSDDMTYCEAVYTKIAETNKYTVVSIGIDSEQEEGRKDFDNEGEAVEFAETQWLKWPEDYRDKYRIEVLDPKGDVLQTFNKDFDIGLKRYF